MTYKQYDALLARISLIEQHVRTIVDNQAELVKAVKALTNKTVVISDINEQITALKNDVQSLKDEGVM